MLLVRCRLSNVSLTRLGRREANFLMGARTTDRELLYSALLY